MEQVKFKQPKTVIYMTTTHRLIRPILAMRLLLLNSVFNYRAQMSYGALDLRLELCTESGDKPKLR
jgi:hypothetical protein